MNFHSWLDEFRPTELRGSKKEVLIFFFIFLLSLFPSHNQTRIWSLLPQKRIFFLNPFCPTYLIWTCGPCHATCPRPVLIRFCPETIYFCLGSSSIYFKMNFTNSFFTFEIFFLKNPVFWVHRTPDASKIEKVRLSRNSMKNF